MAQEQSSGRRHIGVLEMATPDPERLAHWSIFREALGELGLRENEHVVLDFRWANGHQARLAEAAQALVAMRVDVIVTAGTPAAAAALNATREIPIIMATGVSVGTKLADGSTAAPSNITGISDLPAGVSKRRLQHLRDITGAPGPFAMLADRANPSSPLAVAETESAAAEMGLTVRDYWLNGPDQINSALQAMRSDGIGGFVVAPGAMFFAKRAELAASALKHRLPSMSVRREYAEAGCLVAYGAPLRENYRQAASYVSRVLAGTPPSELPVDEPTVFDFVINQATAQALGVDIPPSLRSQAEVI